MSVMADEIWKILREVVETKKETDREILELRQKNEHEITELRQKNEREILELRQKNEHEITELKKETERMSQETKRISQETNQKIAKLGNRLGDFVEDAVRPAAVRLFQKRGIAIHEVYQNVTAQRDNEGLEIDLLVVNDQDVVVIECKSHLDIDDVNEHLQRLDKVKRLLPKYANSRILGAVAAMMIPDNVASYAYRKGLYIIGQTGEQLDIRNDLKFVAKEW